MNWQEAICLIDQAKTICLAGHVRPDGDCLGSVLALAKALELKGKKAVPLKVDKYPSYLSFMPGLDEMKEYEGEVYDLCIIMDVSSLERIGTAKEAFKKAKRTLLIDHHISKEDLADVNLVNSDSIATSEIAGLLIEKMGMDFTPDISSLLYTGICTDSNRFQYENTSPITHRLAAKLMEGGADWKKIHFHLYQDNSYQLMLLRADVLKDCEFYHEGKMNLGHISEKMCNERGLSLEDADEVASLIRDIEGVRVSILIRSETDERHRISFRSKGDNDVSNLAIELGGGGHFHASGCTLKGEYDQVKDKILNMMKDYSW